MKRALRYMIDKNSNPIQEYMNSMPEKGKDLEVHQKCGIGSTLIPCKCPQDFGQVAVIDATTKGRIVKFSIKVNNLCRNKEYIVSVVLYKWVWMRHCKWVKVPIAEDFKIAKYTGCESHGTDTVYFQLAIKEPLCSGQRIDINIISNYVK